MLHLVAYDITSSRRRRKVARLLSTYGDRVNLSVFECELDADALETLILRLRALIARRDHVRIYPLCRACHGRARVIGASRARSAVLDL
jgi:CRISPR-associated protein Cas2